MEEPEIAIQILKRIKGLSDISILDDADREKLRELEKPNNLGVLACLKRKFVICMAHDSSFREPAGDIAIETEAGLVFPAVPFPELETAGRKNVTSSSPSEKAHDFLAKKYKMNIPNSDATLLIGFDI
ncbi:MAG: hypothetical protein AABX75_03020 [Nanoarchaeota archaeon]